MDSAPGPSTPASRALSLSGQVTGKAGMAIQGTDAVAQGVPPGSAPSQECGCQGRSSIVCQSHEKSFFTRIFELENA